MLRAAAIIGLSCGIVVGLSACGGGSKKQQQQPPDPVSMALQAPGVRTVVIPKQSNALTIVVPPCGSAETKQESTKTPPGSNQVVVPRSSLDQTVAVQPCIQGAKQAKGASTVLLSPGGAGSAAQEASQKAGLNQLLLPKKSNLTKIIVPPCLVLTSSSGSSGLAPGGTSTALPATGTKTSVTAPPCQVQMTTSSS
jgi:hypothetical protein